MCLIIHELCCSFMSKKKSIVIAVHHFTVHLGVEVERCLVYLYDVSAVFLNFI